LKSVYFTYLLTKYRIDIISQRKKNDIVASLANTQPAAPVKAYG